MMLMGGRKNSAKNTARPGREKILDAGEKLIAEFGPGYVSLRQIAEYAGLSNPASVQYYFGNKDILIGAIHRDRSIYLEDYRKKLFPTSRSIVKAHLGDLLAALLRPLAQPTGENPAFTYAKFICQFPVDRANREPWHRAHEGLPVTTMIFAEIRERMNFLPEQIADLRMEMMFSMFRAIMSAAAEVSNKSSEEINMIIQNGLEMIVSIITLDSMDF